MSIPIIKTIGACSTSNNTMKKQYQFENFMHLDHPMSLHDCFRENIKKFIQECVQLADYRIRGMQLWSVLLTHKANVLQFYIVEEMVDAKTENPNWQHCRYSGWSNHFVSKRKYHFIIPNDKEWNKPIEDGALNSQSHILHGLIHCNGFGHLICINGIEGGSNFICGREVMDLWDRICTTLHIRQISVVDNSKKRKMDLRLLYGISHGHTWFGRWNYKFCHGSFGVTKDKYEQALQTLSTLELDVTFQDSDNSSIKNMITRYRKLSDTQLVTIRDLFRFMLGLKFRTPQNKESTQKPELQPRSSSIVKSIMKEKQPTCIDFSNLAAKSKNRWTVKRLEDVANVVVDALKDKKAKNENGIMSRQEARDEARNHTKDLGLIDYVLKSMDNVIVGGYLVKRAVNPCTSVFEYSLQDTNQDTIKEVGRNTIEAPTFDPIYEAEVFKDLPNPYLLTYDFGNSEPPEKVNENSDHLPNTTYDLYDFVDNVYPDLEVLYDDILLKTRSHEITGAINTLMDTKSFSKKLSFHDDDVMEDKMWFKCRVIPLTSDLYRFRNSIEEQLVVSFLATFRELKVAAETAMRDTYCIMENLKVGEIVGFDGVKDDELIFGELQSGWEIVVRGLGVDMLTNTNLNYEGGAHKTVKCKCGAMEEDGEEMVECTFCEKWKHRRCLGLDDLKELPSKFCCYA